MNGNINITPLLFILSVGTLASTGVLAAPDSTEKLTSAPSAPMCYPPFNYPGQGLAEGCNGRLVQVLVRADGDVLFAFATAQPLPTICQLTTGTGSSNGYFRLKRTHPGFSEIMSGAYLSQATGTDHWVVVKSGSGGECEIIEAFTQI